MKPINITSKNYKEYIQYAKDAIVKMSEDCRTRDFKICESCDYGQEAFIERDGVTRCLMCDYRLKLINNQ